MLFTRTLRRKLMLGVALVLGMLLILSASGLVGLNSYGKSIRDFDRQINVAPQQAELIKAIGLLAEPLFWRDSDDPDVIERQQQRFRERFAESQLAINRYRARMNDLPPTIGKIGQLPVADALLTRMDDLLQLLKGQESRLSLGPSRPAAVHDLRDRVAVMQQLALQLPDPVEGLRGNLEDAKRVYRSSQIAVCVASGVVVLLFLGLLRSGYMGVFHPIRQLHQGARRVAHGDFNYRVVLNTHDEMSELASAFNQMTSRFQEIAADLDAQVQERSRQLVRSERLAGVGFLAAGVAHEINNPLSAIAMAAESLESRLGDLLERLEPADAAVVRQYLQMVQSESFRCKEITSRLLDFSRGQDAVRETTDLTRLVAEVVSMVQCLGKFRDKTIEFTRTEPCSAWVNGPEIKQVVLNLAANGLEAMQPGGTLRIELIEQTDLVRIEVHDDGCGLSADVMENMFEPFFTRRQDGQGTGLGLSISHRIVSQHGGMLWADSPGPGHGSTFHAQLPRRMPPELSPRMPQAEAAA